MAKLVEQRPRQRSLPNVLDCSAQGDIPKNIRSNGYFREAKLLQIVDGTTEIKNLFWVNILQQDI